MNRPVLSRWWAWLNAIHVTWLLCRGEDSVQVEEQHGNAEVSRQRDSSNTQTNASVPKDVDRPVHAATNNQNNASYDTGPVARVSRWKRFKKGVTRIFSLKRRRSKYRVDTAPAPPTPTLPPVLTPLPREESEVVTFTDIVQFTLEEEEDGIRLEDLETEICDHNEIHLEDLTSSSPERVLKFSRPSGLTCGVGL
ncbi:uncharacterized protein LOC106181351 [Lingula anatina]|uniref:Uncharacterized protein LOC106181351 n=1 Tax=Lingula anatina TaxID=7574 RepID=A0A1S3KEV3_LINAN|nr:uncharacterized protein LOC106181351 [Lingula anatina]|eukprot:XP_013421165.1 uncharacterized protein LOC106181351 [Lingula anatina]